MNVIVHLHTILERKTETGTVGRLDLSLPEDISMTDLLKYLEIEFNVENLLLVVNGRLVELDYVLKEGDEVNLIPAMSGGMEEDRYSRNNSET
jgi:molybdopterin converting factor small subunit